MTTKEEQIMELLRAGKSYTDIQSIVEVSPSKISQVKKEYLTTETDEENTTDTTTFNTDTTTGSDNSSDKNSDSISTVSKIGDKSINNINNITKMDNEKSHDAELRYSDKLALERLKIELAHEAEMKKLENESMEQELRWRDQSLRERKANADDEFLKARIASEISLKGKVTNAGELSLKENKADDERIKTEKQGKILVFNFRKLLGQLNDGKWSKGELIDFFDEKEKLEEKIKRYCFMNGINAEELRMIGILKKIDDVFEMTDEEVDEFIKLKDEHVFDLTFEELSDVIEEAKTVDFDTYE